ncbi:hypothetical protein SCLCIDRAFT_140949 [Scleroderma citrinum Foug A]|uniref:Uncharacterized protein n=1 Tax=Scleroderma citrinum Foug A TaxID=1036808 RepID=A0A0C3CVC6_9AGAM|nr:hypothetical protein SCLCIDRAFT_140949 [Scleroderma citrinum Foug A]
MASSGCASRSSTEDPDIQLVQEYSFDSSEPEEPKATVKTNLREDEVEILEEALEDWKGANKNQRKSMKNAMKARIKNLPTNSTLKGHEWEKKKKALVKYGHKWTARTVVMKSRRKDIAAEFDQAGIRQGSSNMIKGYQKAVGSLMGKLTQEERDAAAEEAHEWNEEHPPEEVQAEMAETKGQEYVKQFAEEMWWQCGMRVVVMAAWKCQNGQPMMGMHDFNGTLGEGKTFQNWDDIKHHWDAYTQDALQEEDADAEDDDAEPKGQRRPQHILPAGDDGTPLIPMILDMQALEQKDIMRTFVTWHYRKACGKKNASVPWAAISTNIGIYISSRHLPQHCEFKEPTRLTSQEVTMILEFWHDRQVTDPADVLIFQKWRDIDGGLQDPVDCRDSSEG